MHKVKNIYFLLIKKKRDGPRQGVAQGRVPSRTSSTNSCLGLSCGRTTLGQLLYDMSCIVNDNHSKKKSHHIDT